MIVDETVKPQYLTDEVDPEAFLEQQTRIVMRAYNRIERVKAKEKKAKRKQAKSSRRKNSN